MGNVLKNIRDSSLKNVPNDTISSKTKSELGEIKAYYDSVVFHKVRVYFLVILFKYFM